MLPPSSSSSQPVGRRFSEDIKLFVNRTAMRPNGRAPFLHAFPHAQALTWPIYGPDKQIWYTLKSPKKCRIMKFVVLKHSATSCLCIFMQVHEHSSVRIGSVLPYWISITDLQKLVAQLDDLFHCWLYLYKDCLVGSAKQSALGGCDTVSRRCSLSNVVCEH